MPIPVLFARQCLMSTTEAAPNGLFVHCLAIGIESWRSKNGIPERIRSAAGRRCGDAEFESGVDRSGGQSHGGGLFVYVLAPTSGVSPDESAVEYE
jgi:hypothetical protein